MSALDPIVRRIRSFPAPIVDRVLAVLFSAVGIASVLGQTTPDGGREASGLAVVTSVAVCAPIAFRRRAPLTALFVSAVAIFVHFLARWPEGTLPLAVLVLTYTVGASYPVRRSVFGLAGVCATIGLLAALDRSRLDAIGLLGALAQFTAAWAFGVAIRSRRAASDARIREAEERAETDRQSAARAIAEERLRIAQELHDVVAHSMSVIAIQAGVGAHVLDDRPEQARAALEAISSVSRGTLTELRRMLGVLRNGDGERSSLDPTPGLADLPQLVQDVRNAGVPVCLHVDGTAEPAHPGIELSAYRVVQEALTNVMKHAGAATRVDVNVSHLPGSIAIDVVDDGRGSAALLGDGDREPGSGQGLMGMRERVELWGGELVAGPAPGGGYRVRARLPYGDPA